MSTLESPIPIYLDDFVTEAAVAELVARRQLTRVGSVLRLRDGRFCVLTEAVRILGSASQETDPYGFTGLTESLASLLRRGFVLSDGRVALGRTIYDAEHGYLTQWVNASSHGASGHGANNNGADESGINPVLR